MPISINELQSASRRQPMMKAFNAFSEQKSKQTAFLCHSHNDSELAAGLQVMLSEKGWDLYIDWQDHQMPEQPNKETAHKIKTKIGSLDWFLFLATSNSTKSKWCPWEIGIADSKKTHDKILIIPTTDNSGHWHGNEYLQLYKKIDKTTDNNLAVFPAGLSTDGTYVRNMR